MSKKWLLIDDLRNIPVDEIARTGEDGLELLRQGGWGTLCIDNDLGEDSIEGYQVINTAIEEGILPSHVQIVSSNPVARENIGRALESEGYITKDRTNYFK